MKRLWLPGLTLFGLTMAALSLHVPGALSIGSLTLKSWFVAITGVSAAVYVFVVLIVTRGAPSRFGIVTVLVVAAALRLPLIVSPPFLSTDVYRYVWDGRIQAAGINPYRYFPGNPVLTALRDTVVYPKINRAEYAPTIYPPMAQLIFAVTGFLWSSVTGVKAAMAGFEILAVVCLLRLLAAAGLPGERVAIYAWNPLPVWAFAGDGHIDAAVTGLVAAALLLRVRHRDGWAGMVLGLAIVTKFLPVIVAPVLWRRRTGWRTIVACPVAGAPYGSILVDRGFTPQDLSQATPQPASPGPANTQPVVGVLRRAPPPNFADPKHRAGESDWYGRDLPGMAAALHAADPAPVYLILESPAAGSGGPTPTPLPVEVRDNLQYAFTWFGLAAALIGVYIATQAARRRKA